MRNCTSYTAQRLAAAGVTPTTLTGLGDGGNWYRAAKNIPVGSLPRVGAAAVIPGSPGHVAYVTAVHTDGSIDVASYDGRDASFYPEYRTNRYANFIYFQNSFNAAGATFVGNWDGVGGDTVGAVARRNELIWNLRNYNSSGNPSVPAFGFGGGQENWIPVVGNWDGVGGDTVGAVARGASELIWHLRNYNSSGSPSVPAFGFGGSGPEWIPVVGNWDGVGGDTIGAVKRTSSGLVWHLRNFNAPGDPSFTPFLYGGQDTFPVVGDWDGNGTSTVGAVRRTALGLEWYLRNSNSPGGPSVVVFTYGGPDFVGGG
jgi:hypothetical protein